VGASSSLTTARKVDDNSLTPRCCTHVRATMGSQSGATSDCVTDRPGACAGGLSQENLGSEQIN